VRPHRDPDVAVGALVILGVAAVIALVAAQVVAWFR